MALALAAQEQTTPTIASPMPADATQRDLPAQDMNLLNLVWYRFSRASRAQRRWALGPNGDGEGGAIQCVDYYEGRQWSEADIQQLDEEGRPHITLNKIGRLIRLILGYQRQNRNEPVVLPDNDPISTQTMAETLTHVVKNVLNDNLYKFTESRVFEDGITTGRGYFDIRLDFDQNILGDIKITDIDPFCGYPDPEADRYDPKTWKFWVTSSWLSLEDILLIFGEQAERAVYSIPNTGAAQNIASDTGTDDATPAKYFGLYKWFNEDRDLDGEFGMSGSNFVVSEHYDKNQKMIRVIDMQHMKLRKVKYFVDLETGGMKAIPDSWDADRCQKVIDFSTQQGRQIQVMTKLEHRVRWTITAGDVILFDEWSPYDDYTVVPYFPRFRRGSTRGMIHDLIDPQREINKRRNAYLHLVTTSANSGWWYEAGSLDPDEEAHLLANGSRAGFVGKYRTGKNKPERIEPVIGSTAFERMENAAAQDLQEISGVNESALGEVDRAADSGKAIENRQRQTLVAIEPEIDNLNLTRILVGGRVVNLVQNFYTEPRFIRSIGLDGKPIEFVINEINAVDEILFDVTAGKYKVSLDSVPAHDTFMSKQFNEIMEMVDKGIIPPALYDMVIEASSLPGKDMWKQRLQQFFAMQMGAALPSAGGAAPAGAPPAPPQGAPA